MNNNIEANYMHRTQNIFRHTQVPGVEKGGVDCIPILHKNIERDGILLVIRVYLVISILKEIQTPETICSIKNFKIKSNHNRR